VTKEGSCERVEVGDAVAVLVAVWLRLLVGVTDAEGVLDDVNDGVALGVCKQGVVEAGTADCDRLECN
jgi:hypothetical protein